MMISKKIEEKLPKTKEDVNYIHLLNKGLRQCKFYTIKSRMAIDYSDKKIMIYPRCSMLECYGNLFTMSEMMSFVYSIKVTIEDKGRNKLAIFSLNFIKLLLLVLLFVLIGITVLMVNKSNVINLIYVSILPGIFMYIGIRWLSIKAFRSQVSKLIKYINDSC